MGVFFFATCMGGMLAVPRLKAVGAKRSAPTHQFIFGLERFPKRVKGAPNACRSGPLRLDSLQKCAVDHFNHRLLDGAALRKRNPDIQRLINFLHGNRPAHRATGIGVNNLSFMVYDRHLNTGTVICNQFHSVGAGTCGNNIQLQGGIGQRGILPAIPLHLSAENRNGIRTTVCVGVGCNRTVKEQGVHAGL